MKTCSFLFMLQCYVEEPLIRLCWFSYMHWPQCNLSLQACAVVPFPVVSWMFPFLCQHGDWFFFFFTFSSVKVVDTCFHCLCFGILWTILRMNVKLTFEENIVLLKMLRNQNNNLWYKLLIYVIIVLEIKVIN